MLDTSKIANTTVNWEPFLYFAVSDAFSQDSLAQIRDWLAKIQRAGIFPLDKLNYDDAFAELIGEIKSSELESLMSRQFQVDLSEKPLMISRR